MAEERLRWFFAGKIGPVDWREDVVSGIRKHCEWLLAAADANESYKWRPLSDSVMGRPGWDYIGPYYDAGKHVADVSQAIDPQGWGHGSGRPDLQRMCFAAIEAADIVFAWIDSEDAFGTLVEIGYAAAHGKRVAVAFDKRLSAMAMADLWFAAGCNTERGGGIYSSPHEALRLLEQEWRWLSKFEGQAEFFGQQIREGEQKIVALEELLRTNATRHVGVSLDPQRAFSEAQRREIKLRANEHCCSCAKPLGAVWHADHILPHARGGRTEIQNSQALCADCNQRKSAKVLIVDQPFASPVELGPA